MSRHLAPVQAYVAALTLVGAAIVGYAAVAAGRTAFPLEAIAFGVLSMIAGRFPLRVPGSNAWLSISDTFFMTSALMFGPAPATLAIALDSLVLSYGCNSKLSRFLFNGSAPAVAFWIGAQVYASLSGAGPLYGATPDLDGLLLPLAGFAGIYFLLNSGLTAIAVALEKNMSPIRVWREQFAVVSLNYLAAASAAFVLVAIAQFVSFAAVVAVLPLIVIIHFAMRSWTGRVEDAERHVAEIDKLYLSTVGALSSAIEAKDGVTSSHIHRVQYYAMALARAMGGLDDKTLKAIEAAALLHDTGKLAVPERILNKPGKLTPAEFETMKLHVDAGADILSTIDFPYPVVPIVRAHHENWDGTGYPNRLKGAEIPIGARILSVVDCYDALTSDRPYRPAMSDADALAIIRERRGTMYDPDVVELFERVCLNLAPPVLKPQLQKAVQRITAAQAHAAVRAVDAKPMVASDSMHALAHLARIVSGRPTAADVASLIWAHVRPTVPNATCAFFLDQPAGSGLSVRFAAGDGSTALQGLTMVVGERVTGWVAEHRQAIVNSNADLDLGPEAAFLGLRYCVALPLATDGRMAGVFTLYSAEPFRDDQVDTLQSVLPHLAVMFLTVERRSESSAALRVRSGLRMVATR
jgi:putative nucleotidyltransferase with HDIG domain